ncbi:hypothetical protein GGTG_13772 [Gaeumannomyces tritici R3-111a-1]|uniref:DUF676 domain-containing protein n=1 Tax=Gaeumannomyces tritici (strain R3-111a-1) TaxID=644352 RepID=J3PJT3_GAET3|nr:hypothetical protein GGTG_13772 [Gaeumannomyces tritici R3-111a-1]EJT68656.1 hypothetical protein GGTG_13772 [Gaeumannomyces tritici R3-111a-1]
MSSLSKTEFCSQGGGRSVINYSYTDLPWRLLGYDVYYFFRFFWAIPYIVVPINKPLSGSMSELAPTRQNAFCIAIHVLLCILQLVFILLLPFAAILPGWISALAIGAYLFLNTLICKLLNGKEETYLSTEKYAPKLEQHAHEQWIYLNGVAAGTHWLQNNLDRLALTFKRPILGIHNKTDGILFDVIECLVQRTFGYATGDVRLCYRIVKEKLYDPRFSKVILILHSQGGIEGGMVLDWLLQELPQDLLAKLEVYTFGNAANHFNNPHRHIGSEESTGPGLSTSASNQTPATSGTNGVTNGDHGTARVARLTREASSSQPSAVSDRVIGHVEHFAHTTDFVALWGVLHFATSAVASPSMPRFIGRVFARSSERGGHQFCHHYLDGMFPLKADASAPGGFSGCLEAGPDEGQNEFMDSEVVVGAAGDEYSEVHSAYEASWFGGGGGALAGLKGAAADGSSEVDRLPAAAAAAAGTGAVADTGNGEVTVHSASPVLSRAGTMKHVVKVKHLCRLWQYRDGRSPEDAPGGVNGVLRGMTL